MPELPEVETIKNEIIPFVVGHKIESVDIITPEAVTRPSPGEFREKITGRTITGLKRRGKYLFFHLDKGGVLMMHMKLGGALLANPSPGKHTHIVLHLDNGAFIELRDPRKFARMWLEKNARAVTDKLGPEPLDKDFTVETLADILKKRAAPVKAVILNQALISGIGNMYADEALFEARVHPARPANKLSPAEVKKLHAAIRNVLLKGIARKGASVRDYIRPDGRLGSAQNDFLVAHGVGNKCPGCEGTIQRIVVRGRGTYICPKCQPYP